MQFQDRRHAGYLLGQKLAELGFDDIDVVLALPRGGVPVAYEVAVLLGTRLDVFAVRKLGLPGHEELAMGAVGPGGSMVLNESVITLYGVDDEVLAEARARETEELGRRLAKYRGGDTHFDLEDRNVLVVDDGLATGATMRVACHALRQLKPRALHVAVPVASKDTCAEMSKLADSVLCLETPKPFFGVGQFYRNFRQTSDDEVLDLLARSRERTGRDDLQAAN